MANFNIDKYFITIAIYNDVIYIQLYDDMSFYNKEIIKSDIIQFQNIISCYDFIINCLNKQKDYNVNFNVNDNNIILYLYYLNNEFCVKFNIEMVKKPCTYIINDLVIKLNQTMYSNYLLMNNVININNTLNQLLQQKIIIGKNMNNKNLESVLLYCDTLDLTNINSVSHNYLILNYFKKLILNSKHFINLKQNSNNLITNTPKYSVTILNLTIDSVHFSLPFFIYLYPNLEEITFKFSNVIENFNFNQVYNLVNLKHIFIIGYNIFQYNTKLNEWLINYCSHTKINLEIRNN